MATYSLALRWQRNTNEVFINNHYSRGHTWLLDGGIEVPASSSSHIVPLPFSVEAAIDPEEAFVASIASCHMLWFLSIAAARRLIVDRYEDHPEGTLARNAQGQLAMVSVDLKPTVSFQDQIPPSTAIVEQMHALAHEQCFIAHSVRTEIRIKLHAETGGGKP